MVVLSMCANRRMMNEIIAILLLWASPKHNLSQASSKLKMFLE